MVLPLRVWGMDTEQKMFSLLAHTLDISRGGARLGGIRVQLNLGDVIGVQYRASKARFKVTWLGRIGKPDHDQIGIEQLEPVKDIWGLDLPREVVEDDPNARDKRVRPKEARSHPRYAWNAGVEVAGELSDTGYWATLNDISLTGCYVHTASPAAVGSTVKLTIKGGEYVIRVWGEARTSDPALGMGVRFTEFVNTSDHDHLRSLVSRLSRGEKVSTTQARPSAAVAAEIRKLEKSMTTVLQMIALSKPDVHELESFQETLALMAGITRAIAAWMQQSEGGPQDPFAAVQQLNTERMRLAGHLCKHLRADMQAMKMNFPAEESARLLKTVEDLFAQLTGLDLVLGDEGHGQRTA